MGVYILIEQQNQQHSQRQAKGVMLYFFKEKAMF